MRYRRSQAHALEAAVYDYTRIEQSANTWAVPPPKPSICLVPDKGYMLDQAAISTWAVLSTVTGTNSLQIGCFGHLFGYG